MMINGVQDLGNGISLVEVLDTSSGLISRYTVATGSITAFMKELRNN